MILGSVGDCPCYNCKDRCSEPVNCHSICSKYKDWSDNHKKKKDKESAQKNLERQLFIPNPIYNTKKH